jgi:hypothetical protein
VFQKKEGDSSRETSLFVIEGCGMWYDRFLSHNFTRRPIFKVNLVLGDHEDISSFCWSSGCSAGIATSCDGPSRCQARTPCHNSRPLLVSLLARLSTRNVRLSYTHFSLTVSLNDDSQYGRQWNVHVRAGYLVVPSK